MQSVETEMILHPPADINQKIYHPNFKYHFCNLTLEEHQKSQTLTAQGWLRLRGSHTSHTSSGFKLF